MKLAIQKARLTQPEIERHYFEQFKKAYPLPAGKIEYKDKPDVIITGTQKIGIEITNFYLAEGGLTSSEQVQSKWRRSVVSAAQRSYMQNDGKNVEFTFGFDKSHPIEDVPAVAQKIADLARKLEDWPNGQISRREYDHVEELDFMYLYARELLFSDDPVPGFPDGEPDVSQDHLLRNWMEYRNRREARALQAGIYKPLPFTAQWKVTQAHSFGLMSVKRLEDIVRAKEVKAQDYAECNAYWLLVVVEFIDAAQEQEIRVDGISLVSDVFERVIVYKPGFEHIVPIIPLRSRTLNN